VLKPAWFWLLTHHSQLVALLIPMVAGADLWQELPRLLQQANRHGKSWRNPRPVPKSRPEHMQEVIECFSFVLPRQTYLPHTTMRTPNLPPLFLQPRHWWLNPLRFLPRPVLAELLHRRLSRLAPASVSTSGDANLWEGTGMLLLASDDPHCFRLLPWVRTLVERFPNLRMLTLEPLAPYWQALVPTMSVLAMPKPDLWDESFLQWVSEELDNSRSDWCWNLGDGDDPLSLALLRILGRSWRIGKGPKGWANLSMQVGNPLGSKSEEMAALFQTFGWEAKRPRILSQGGILGIEMPALSPKALPAWMEFTQALGRQQTTKVYAGTPDTVAASIPALPAAKQLLEMAPRLVGWIGPWNLAAGALSALGVPVLAWSRCRMEEVPSFHHLPAGDVALWWDEKKPRPNGDEAS